MDVDQRTIVLVEDDLETAQVMSDVLHQQGYHVEHASTAAEAMTLLGRLTPDLVVLDRALPDADGLAFCSALRSDRDMPVLLCTAWGCAETYPGGERAAPNAVLAKPFDIAQLERGVDAILGTQIQGR